MSSPSCVSHDDSTSICAADASLDIRFAFDMALKRSICPVGRGEKAQSTLVAEGNISNFEQSEKYIEWSQRDHISSCVATYRHIEGIDIEFAIGEHIDKIKE